MPGDGDHGTDALAEGRAPDAGCQILMSPSPANKACEADCANLPPPEGGCDAPVPAWANVTQLRADDLHESPLRPVASPGSLSVSPGSLSLCPEDWTQTPVALRANSELQSSLPGSPEDLLTHVRRRRALIAGAAESPTQPVGVLGGVDDEDELQSWCHGGRPEGRSGWGGHKAKREEGACAEVPQGYIGRVPARVGRWEAGEAVRDGPDWAQAALGGPLQDPPLLARLANLKLVTDELLLEAML